MRRSVFLRCLLFYLLFLLVLMGMYVPLYRLNLNMITEKSVQVSETMLYSRLKQFEYELSQTRTLSTRLSGTAALTQLSHISVPPTGKDVYKAYNALGTYATLTSLLPAGMTAGMYLSNGVAMVGEYLFYTMEEMYQFASDSRFETHAQWRAFVNDFTGPSCLFAERQITMMDRTFPALEYAVRMPLTSNSSSKLLFVFITGESVHELLSLTDLYPDTVLRLYDGNGALLLGRGDEGGQAYMWISAAIHAGHKPVGGAGRSHKGVQRAAEAVHVCVRRVHPVLSGDRRVSGGIPLLPKLPPHHAHSGHGHGLHAAGTAASAAFAAPERVSVSGQLRARRAEPV